MALKTWPSGLLILSHDIQPVNPSQVVHRIINTNKVQVFEGGYGTWLGTSDIAPRKNGNIVEAFLASLNSETNTVEMPLLRDTISGGDVSITGVSGNVYTLASRPTGIKVGCYVRSGARLFIVESVSSGATPNVGLWPLFPLTTNDSISIATSILVRSRGAPVMPRVRDSYGPWSFRWEQA